MFRIGKFTETESRFMVAQGSRGGEGMTANGYEVSFGEMENVLKLIVMMVEQFYEYTKKKKQQLLNCVI